MPITNGNNEKTESLKRSLDELLNKLEQQKQIIATQTAYFYRIANSFQRNKLESLNKAACLLSKLNNQFNAVDDLNSVKKLRQTELFFLNNIKEFKFPHYKSHIHPSFVIYAAMDLHLDKLEKQANKLSLRGHKLASIEAKSIVTLLRPLNHSYFKENRIGYYDYKSKFLAIINQGRPKLEEHRGCKKILSNLFLLIITLGTFHIANNLVNKHFLFSPETKSSEQLTRLEHRVSQLNS